MTKLENRSIMKCSKCKAKKFYREWYSENEWNTYCENGHLWGYDV